MLHWAKQFNIFCFLDSHDYNLPPHQWDCLLAADAIRYISGSESSIEKIDDFLTSTSWSFGHINYEALHGQYNIISKRTSALLFPPFYFFQPRYLLRITDGILYIEGDDSATVFAAIEKQSVGKIHQSSITTIKARLSKDEYVHTVEKLLQHIQRGDCYEINFCQEFFADDASIDPLNTYIQLVQLAPNPFCAFYKWNGQYLICASPERFIKKEGRRVLSQPMKGTASRDLFNDARDEETKDLLRLSEKDRAENVMVVDMVRNDLSKICNNVNAEELFGIQSFPYVHQMVSTITGDFKDDITFSAVIRATFPMGSMTGAPKKRVMQLTEQYEPQARGIFSGSVGYIDPNGNFDFNVVIRSIMYNSIAKYLSYQVGSGITVYSRPEAEWEECLLKGAAIKKVLTGRSALL